MSSYEERRYKEDEEYEDVEFDDRKRSDKDYKDYDDDRKYEDDRKYDDEYDDEEEYSDDDYSSRSSEGSYYDERNRTRDTEVYSDEDDYYSSEEEEEDDRSYDDDEKDNRHNKKKYDEDFREANLEIGIPHTQVDYIEPGFGDTSKKGAPPISSSKSVARSTRSRRSHHTTRTGKSGKSRRSTKSSKRKGRRQTISTMKLILVSGFLVLSILVGVLISVVMKQKGNSNNVQVNGQDGFQTQTDNTNTNTGSETTMAQTDQSNTNPEQVEENIPSPQAVPNQVPTPAKPVPDPPSNPTAPFPVTNPVPTPGIPNLPGGGTNPSNCPQYQQALGLCGTPPSNFDLSAPTGGQGNTQQVPTSGCSADMFRNTFFINEFHYQNKGPDFAEFVEVVYPADVDISRYWVEFYDADGKIYNQLDLKVPATFTTEYDGALAIASFGHFGIDNAEMGPNGLALVDPSGKMLDFISYGAGVIVGTDGSALNKVSNPIGVAETGDTSITMSVQLSGTGFDKKHFTWVGPGDSSPGSLNDNQSFTNCDVDSSLLSRPTTAPDILINQLPTRMPTPNCDFGDLVFINEVHYRNEGIDFGEFVEVVHSASVNLVGYQMQFYTFNGNMYKSFYLGGLMTTSSSAYKGQLVFTAYGQVGVDDSPAGIALVDPEEKIIDFVSYGGITITAQYAGQTVTSFDMGVEEPDNNPRTHSLQLIGEGFRRSDFYWVPPAVSTAGFPNTNQTFICP